MFERQYPQCSDGICKNTRFDRKWHDGNESNDVYDDNR